MVMEGSRDEDEALDVFWPIGEGDLTPPVLPPEVNAQSDLLRRRRLQSPMRSMSSNLQGRIFPDFKMTNQFESPAKYPDMEMLRIPPGFLQQSISVHPCDSRSDNSSSADGSSFEFISSSAMAQNLHPLGRDEASAMIDRLLQKKALPEKGKLLQAVIEAGPLLETLLVAGYLPKWRNPPPLLSFQIDLMILRRIWLQNLRVHPPLYHSKIKIPEQEPAPDEIAEDLSRNVVSATAAISSLGRRGRHSEALQLLRRLLSLGLRPNQFTFGTAIHSATACALIDIGKQLHAQATRTGLHSNVFVGSSLVDFYGKLGAIEEASSTFSAITTPNVFSHTALLVSFLRHKKFFEARRLFDEMPERNQISWNAMISGLSKIGENDEALKLFVEMRREGEMSSRSTFPAVISAAGNAAALRLGEALHAYAAKHVGDDDAFLGSSLISFYSKCGLPEHSLQIFILGTKNLVSWNALICGLAQNGMGRETLEIYQMMIQNGLKANEVTLLGLLSACGHCGMVEEGCEILRRARFETPELFRAEHYASAADMMARHGRYLEARRFVAEAGVGLRLGFWKAMVGGSLVEAAERRWAAAVAKGIEEEGAGEDGGAYVLLSNAYSAAGMWGRVAEVREEMKERGVERSPGCSWIEVEGRVKVFFNGDRGEILVVEMCKVLDLCLSNF